MRTVSLAALALLVLAPGAGPAAPTSEKPLFPFTLAVVRRDAILVPFATYDGKKWSNPWPVPKERFNVPLSLRDVPKKWWGRQGEVTEWTFWPLEGDSRALRALAPVMYQAHCLMNVGLKSDYKATIPIPPPDGQPHPKEGLASTGTIPIERIEVLDKAAPEWKQVADRIPKAVTAAEDHALSLAGFPHPVGRNEREKVPVTLEVLCRSPGARPDTSIYYFEALKRYEKKGQSGQPECQLVTLGYGWLVQNGERALSAYVTNCAREGADFMLPLGLIRLDGKPLWVVQWGGWDHERYAVLDVTPDGPKTLFETPGGACW